MLFFSCFLTKAGSFQASIAELQALTAALSEALKDLRTTYSMVLAWSHLYKLHVHELGTYAEFMPP